MKRRSIRRRDVLAAAGGSLVGLPWLESLVGPKSASAQVSGSLTASGQPKRLLVFFKGNGVYADEWFPTPGNTERDFTLNRTTEPLEPYRSQINILDGVDNHVVIQQPDSPGEQHNKGSGSILTSWELNEGNIRGADGTSFAGYGKGPSIDQVIARHIGTDSPILSLEVGVHSASGNRLSRPINYEGNLKPIQSQHDPAVVFDQVFAQRSLPADQAAALRGQRTELLRFTNERFASISQVVSRQDRLRLAEHAEHLRSLEQRFAQETGTTCAFPEGPAGNLNPDDHNNTEIIFQLQRDMIVQAFGCGLTRVATIMAGNGANPLSFNFLDDHGADHPLAHGEQNRQNAVNQRRGRHLWGMQQLHDILAALEAVPEGDGTLLDSTLVLFVSENSNGWHSHTRLPIVLAGSLGGWFDTGRTIQLPQRPAHTDVLISVLNAFGIEGSDFGNPDFNNGPLAGLTA